MLIIIWRMMDKFFIISQKHSRLSPFLTINLHDSQYSLNYPNLGIRNVTIGFRAAHSSSILLLSVLFPPNTEGRNWAWPPPIITCATLLSSDFQLLQYENDHTLNLSAGWTKIWDAMSWQFELFMKRALSNSIRRWTSCKSKPVWRIKNVSKNTKINYLIAELFLSNFFFVFLYFFYNFC